MGGIFRDGFFTSVIDKWPGRSVSVRITEPIVSLETDSHLMEIFRGEGFGLVLALDGTIRFSESDSFMFSEMFAHTAAFAHENPETVLVCGDPVGSVVRELLKHPCIEQIDWCEPDETLSGECRRRFPQSAEIMDNSRVECIPVPGKTQTMLHPMAYDLILAAWPEEPAPQLQFIQAAKKALKPGGIFGLRSGALMPHTKIALEHWKSVSKHFEYTDIASVPVPSFPGGSCGFVLASDHSVIKPVRRPIGAFVRNLKAYSPETHASAFVYPPLWRKTLRDEGEED